MRRALLLAGGLAVALAGAVAAHDFWLVPEFFQVPEGWQLHVAGQTGMEFPESESAVSLDRLADAKLVSASETVPIGRKAQLGRSLWLEARPTGPGEWWVAVALHPRPIHLTAEQFNDYLAHEGLPHILAERKAQGLAGRDADERYTKFAKALVRVGTAGATVFDRPLGHAIEFVPLNEPLELQAGDEIAARLLFRGRPLPGVAVFAGRAGAGAGPTAQATTDGDGVARFALYVSGYWYLKAIHMLPAAPDSGFDYESWWATLTFEVAAAPEPAAN
ncbi:MAG: DUF4198 domain-containing protein [Gemmatimonadetes bacterium]|nr:DUF4198 domain-containing protein [Gemmatimonadota bacterium]